MRHLEDALAAAGTVGMAVVQASEALWRGRVALAERRFGDAAELLEQAQIRLATAGARTNRSAALLLLGWCLCRLGRATEAVGVLGEAEPLLRETGVELGRRAARVLLADARSRADDARPRADRHRAQRSAGRRPGHAAAHARARAGRRRVARGLTLENPLSARPSRTRGSITLEASQQHERG